MNQLKSNYGQILRNAQYIDKSGRLRTSKQYRSKDIHNATGLSSTTIRKILNGRQDCNYKAINAVATALNKDIKELYE